MSERAHLGRGSCCAEGKSFVLEQLARHLLREQVVQQIYSILSSQTVATTGGRRVSWLVCRWDRVRQCLHSCMPRGFISAIWTWHSREWRYFEVDA